jgi:hypothetical protein
MKVSYDVVVTRKGHVVPVARHSKREQAERMIARLKEKHRIKGTLFIRVTHNR